MRRPGSAGRLSVEKHAHRSIDAVAASRDSGIDARLVIAGEGPLRAKLERQAARLAVHFTGFIGCRDAVATIMASVDVALAPGPHESFGLAALEALACGTPAIAHGTSALVEIVTADSGAAVDNDPRAIAAAVTASSADPSRCAATQGSQACRTVFMADLRGRGCSALSAPTARCITHRIAKGRGTV